MTYSSSLLARPGWRRRGLLALAALVAAVVAVPAGPVAADDLRTDTVRHDVSFEVANVNRSAIPCDADGGTYTLRGTITAPATGFVASGDQAVTLMLHGLGYGEFFSTFEAVPGYDFAEKQARDGHVTVAIDRLGYEDSDQPNGFDICLGSQADMAHQVIEDLRIGDYTVEGIETPSFDQVVLAGHSVGGLLVEATAYSFGNADALIVMSYSDVVVSDLALEYAGIAAGICRDGGRENESGVAGYAPYGRDVVDFVIGHFNTGNADPAVVRQTADMQNINPCGDLLSFMAAVETNLENVGGIDVPVLVVAGEKDAFFPPPAVPEQADLFTSSPAVRTAVINATGHAITLHKSRNKFQAEVSTFLDEFAPPADPQSRLERFGTTLDPLNGSGATGRATLTVLDPEARTVRVSITASGLTPGLPHAQHLHGERGVDNTCPGPTADENGDGIITVAEGLPAYGPILLPLTEEVGSFPVADENGDVSYERTFVLSELSLSEIGLYAIVQHGIDLDGSGAYDGEARSSLDPSLPLEATVPATCGALTGRA